MLHREWEKHIMVTSPRPPRRAPTTGPSLPRLRIEKPPCETAVLSVAGEWAIARVRGREEKAVADRLSADGVAVYLPLVTVTRVYLRPAPDGTRKPRREKVKLAAFPNYVFLAWVDAAGMNAAYRTRGVLEVMRIVASAQSQLRRELDQVQRALAINSELRPADWIKPGRDAEVTEGPFAGMRGQIHERRGNRVFLIGVKTLGGGVELEVADHELQQV